jgi:hypothetical protein
MIKVHITDDWASAGIKVFIISQGEGDRLLLQLHEDGCRSWERSTEPGVEPPPTVTLDDDEGRAC